ncbi:MAG: Na+/H+ antiporter NhaC family protein [Longimonas sp.]|uniref:Na+/H+ antiporter NhaC family protein n=1 Tax=Longimonas sp. TaxID=2039626 RepID=UPI003357E3E6
MLPASLPSSRLLLAVLAACCLSALLVNAPPAHAQSVEAPRVVLNGIAFDIRVDDPDESLTPGAQVQVGSASATLEPDDGGWVAEGLIVRDTGGLDVQLVQGGQTLDQARTRAIPAWLSILPPLLAIGMALAFKRVVPALFLGIWVGAWMAAGFSISGLFVGLLETLEIYVLGALANESHVAIILFSLMIGGMVGIISKNGGTYGIVERLVTWANTPRRAQLATGTLGVGMFFDDYANTLVVGNTMRPVTDRLKVSREKLAYIVDSTAAPIACVALVTTWIGYQVGLVGTAVEAIDGFNEGAYSIFLSSLAYSFYPWLALYFVFVVANSNRDFGPMARAEIRARTTGQVASPNAKLDEAAAEDNDEMAPKEGIPLRALNAVIPIVVLVGSVLAGLYWTGVDAAGSEASIREIIGAADSYTALLWGSLLGVIAAAALSIGQQLLSLEETVDAWYSGLKSMLFAMIILVLAWALSDITEVLHTADYLVSILGTTLHPGIVPAIIFVLAAATAFATGSSWGTMGILMPLVIPLVWAVLQANNMADPTNYHIMYSAVSCVLAGSVWGDHCSPISDTTILSSMASGCDHIDHVRTQLPYALSVGFIALALGTIPAGFGFPWWASLILGAILLSTALRMFGTPVPETSSPEASPAGNPEASASDERTKRVSNQ